MSELKAVLRAIRSFQLAATEFQRAKSTGEQPRLSRAGTRYEVMKWRMFQTSREARRKQP